LAESGRIVSCRYADNASPKKCDAQKAAHQSWTGVSPHAAPTLRSPRRVVPPTKKQLDFQSDAIYRVIVFAMARSLLNNPRVAHRCPISHDMDA
jgi:hypothetical protein